MIMNGNMIKRISLYVLGLFVMTVGIAFSFRSDLGSSPVSSIPYSMMYVWAIEVGFATILFHIALVILQFLILRENFKAKILLQVVAGVLFGYFTTLAVYLVSFVPKTSRSYWRLYISGNQYCGSGIWNIFIPSAPYCSACR